MSLTTEQQRNKTASLNALKQRRNITTVIDIDDDDDLRPTPSSSSGKMLPPAQSRDATTSTRFQYSTPRSPATILAPNSSPTGIVDGKYHGVDVSPSRFYQSNGGSGSENGMSELKNKYRWQPSGGSRKSDPLSTATLFTSQKVSRPQTHQSHNATAATLQASSSSNSTQIPDSPAVQRPGKRRRITADSSEDDAALLSGSATGPSRIIRGVRTGEQGGRSSESSPGFYLFTIINTGMNPSLVRQVFDHFSGDTIKAQGILDKVKMGTSPDSLGFSSNTVATSRSPPASAENKLEQERRLKREEDKERSKQSAIYANRSRLNGTVESLPEIVSNIIETSPAHLRRLVKKRVNRTINSESDYEEDDSDDSVELIEARSRSHYEDEALKWFNESSAGTLQELSGCSSAQAEAILQYRPFSDIEDLKSKLGQGSKRKTGPAGLSPNLLSDCIEILKNYGVVDDVLERCEKIGEDINRILDRWTTKQISTGEASAPDAGALEFTELGQISTDGFLRSQPATLSEGVTLKEYQLIGLNWLDLLYTKKRSCILADEMGLGKTVQVISFIALLKERGTNGPHLIVVPSSTLENWTREFEHFAPSISWQTYYGNKDERKGLRQQLKSKRGEWEVLITTYNLAQGDEFDRKFFCKTNWETCIFDEGHILKNFQSQRYTALVRIPSKWRLLLTGTPLQNNLEELVSLMNFILPNLFVDVAEELRRIFKSRADSTAAFLSRDRITRAKRMMTPFVLRRRKDQVLKELPKKVERVEYCDMSLHQRGIYNEVLKRSRTLAMSATPIDDSKMNNVPIKGAKNARSSKLSTKDTSTNVLMDLRKAASHPMLFRRKFDDATLTSITRELLRLPDFVKRRAQFELVKEDMEVMTDSELQFLCQQHKTTEKFALKSKCFEDAGKVSVLLKLLRAYQDEGRRVLIFSQFTQILDILQAILKNNSIKYLMLTGSTPVDVRQALVDEFTEDESISVFLLSTKAGGMGINLTAASVVIIFDQDYNPHNDKQASDRAYRIGQLRDVDVIKLVTKGTIEEHMLRLGRTKLALDEAVAGEKGGEKAEETMKTSLMSTLRQEYVELGDKATPEAITIDE